MGICCPSGDSQEDKPVATIAKVEIYEAKVNEDGTVEAPPPEPVKEIVLVEKANLKGKDAY